ncbi:mannitol dehydrogenase [Sphingomonas sp. Root710]|uniref:mannitol dehydrogenase family protein n=1 Tax=Sphingomonas sp. Root710 TaxID=1736594 RepID=UPI0006F203A5|nr:mannitol dehydrogenase family protein [Sphingomonas sp. Root710]KRB80684.1 mannitol dehydrogenase [Sphingomonas sp. Root710]
MKLNRSTLNTLPVEIGRPGYGPGDLRAGILHFGVGNFHRAHQGSYLDRLFSQGLSRDWGIVGAGVMPAEQRMRNILIEQDFLSLLVTRSAERDEARVIAPMVDYLPIGDHASIIGRMTDPAIRIVSLTVTEGGYFLDGDGRFDCSHPDIQADVAREDRPHTVFGMILAALDRRRAAGLAPFTVMSCDNLPHNGRVVRGTVTGMARLSDPSLADWIDRHVAFPNGMVDRITPATTDRERLIAAEKLGCEDQWPVFSEDFIQWVLEDDFPQGRPELEAAGVTFTKDVTRYEHMKLRVLNASHAMIAYPAALMGIEYAHEAVIHPLIAPMLEKVQRDEVLPALTPVPEMAPDRYFAIVRSRFANPKIADTIARLCHDGANRQPKFIVPAIRTALDEGLPVNGLALASALWCRYCAGTRDDGAAILSEDPRWPQLNRVARAARSEPGVWLDQRDIYGSVGENPVFREAFARALRRIYGAGVAATLASFAAAS